VSTEGDIEPVDVSDEQGASGEEAPPPSGVEEASDIRIVADVLPEWSWAAALADLPQIRALQISSSTAFERVQIFARLWDGDVTIAEAVLGERGLPAGDTGMNPKTLSLHSGYMATREERSGATLDLSVKDMTRGGHVVATTSLQVDVQPPDLWWRAQGGPELAEGMLAAFVRPNAPVVAEIARAALDYLPKFGEDASFDAYQQPAEDQPAKADHTAMALAQAIRDRRIGYSEPPPAWDYLYEGQRIRSHEAVAAPGLGTCLDTTVLMAACLEHVGLRPVLVLVTGHAFCGYWRTDFQPPETVLTDTATAANLVQAGQIGLIETTMLTVSNDAPLEDVFRADERNFFRGDPHGEFRALVDVAAARARRVSPLPVLVHQANGDLQVVEYRVDRPEPRVETVTADERQALDELAGRLRDEQPARLRKWKSELLTLNAKSPLLNLPTNAYVQPIVLPPRGLGRVEDALHLDREFEIRSGFAVGELLQARGVPNMVLADDDDVMTALASRVLYVQRLKTSHGEKAPISPQVMLTELRTLARRAKDAKDERGMNPLFLVLGLLRWGEGPAGAIPAGEAGYDSPLVMVPVRLSGGLRGRPLGLSLDSSSHVTPNFALIEWLRREHGLTVPGLAEPALDKAGIDVDGVLEAVRSAVSSAHLSLQVVPEARLAFLDVGAFRMWKDLQDHGSSFLECPLVRHLVQSPTEPFIDEQAIQDDVPNLDDIVLPVAADAAQTRAVAWVRQGRTFVLQGPPGTGKSQTITNMIAACVADGRKVLFVAEKQTALAVVRRRLDAVGLGAFSLNLHQEGSSGAQVREQLMAAIRARAESDPAVMEVAERQRRTSLYQLQQYPDSLHSTNQAGYSAYSARDQLLVLGDGPTLQVSEEAVARKGEDVRAASGAARNLPPLAIAARPRPGHPWRLVGSVVTDPIDVAATQQIVTRLLDAAASCRSVTGATGDLVLMAATVDQLRQIATVGAPDAPDPTAVQVALQPEWTQSSVNALRAMQNTATQGAASLGAFHPDVLSLDLEGIQRAETEARAGKFIGRKGRAAAALAPLAAYQGPALLTPEAMVATLPALVQLRAHYVYAQAWVRAQPALAVAADWNPFIPGAIDPLIEQVNRLESAAAPLREASDWGEAIRAAIADGSVMSAHLAVAAFVAGWDALVTALAVGGDDLMHWQAERSLMDALIAHDAEWRNDVTDRLIALQRWIVFRRVLAPLAALGLQDTAAALADGTAMPDQIEEALERGIAHASLSERLHASGLDLFDGQAHQGRIDAFRASEHTIRREWPGHASRALIEGRSEGASVGALQRELTKTRGRLGTRAILQQHGAAVQMLTPIILTSPSSAVDLIEPGTLEFDVVIFDEASQITVPEAVGALGRARAAVVVGDSKQMPPSRGVGGGFAQQDDDELADGEEEVIEDQESILSECELARVPALRLDWHYRSQDEALIAFSNKSYYDGALSSFPTPTLLSDATGVTFRRVQGQYIRSGGRPAEALAVQVRERIREVSGSVPFANTNIEEALAIVDEVSRLIQEHPRRRPSIGIVTFNEQQRVLITSLLQASDDLDIQAILSETEMGAEDVLFVKALEQVQGDERDVVLFSVAFSKQANGKIPLNFGRLSTLGGERRLNVAITRARRKNTMFCSFDPGELDAERSSYSGVKHLKAYLIFAKESSTPGRGAQLRVGAAVRDRHRDEIANALRARGLNVTTDVGMSDFRLDLVLAQGDHPEIPVLPVLLDGELWRRRETVGDREILPVDVLTGLMGWPRVARVWWPMWVQNQDEALTSLLAEFDAALDAMTANAPQALATDAPVDAVVDSPVEIDIEAPQWAAAVPIQPETPAAVVEEALSAEIPESPAFDGLVDITPTPRIDAQREPLPRVADSPVNVPVPASEQPPSAPLDVLPEYVMWHRDLECSLDGLADPELDDLLVEIVGFEGPMHAEVAYRRIVKACGGSKLGSRVRERLDASLARCTRRKRVAKLKDTVREPLHKTLYIPGQEPVIPRSAGDRALEDVPRSELAAVGDMFPEDVDYKDLVRAVLALYGRKSLTGQAEAVLTQAFKYTWSEG
jgi:hypothetical protein